MLDTCFRNLVSESASPTSRFYQKIDASRLGIAGHSLGGATTMMVAARDERVKAAVGLDTGESTGFTGRGHLGLSDRGSQHHRALWGVGRALSDVQLERQLQHGVPGA